MRDILQEASRRIETNDPTMIEAYSEQEVHAYRCRQIAQALPTNTYLRTLNLTLHSKFLGSRFLFPLASGIRRSRLTHLQLHDLSFETFMVIYQHGINHSDTLQELSISFRARKKYERLYREKPDSDDDDEDFPMAPAKTKNTRLPRLVVEFRSLNVPDAKVVARVIREAHLTSIVLSGGNLDILTLLHEQGVRKSKTIRSTKLGMSGQDLMDDGKQLATILPSIQHMRSFGRSFFNVLVDTLSQPSGAASVVLTTLVLECCRLTSGCMKTLCAWMGVHNSLTSLNFSEHTVNDETMIIFVENWRTDSSLRKLELRCNPIGQACALKLVEAVASHPALEVLNLSYNSAMDLTGLQQIALALPNLRLREFHLYPWSQDLAPKKGILIDAARSNYYLRRLVLLCSLQLPLFPVEVEELDFLMTRNKYLQGTVSPDLWLSPTLACHVLARYSDRSDRIFTLVQENPMLFS